MQFKRLLKRREYPPCQLRVMAVQLQLGDELALLLDVRSRPSDVLLGARQIVFQKGSIHATTLLDECRVEDDLDQAAHERRVVAARTRRADE
jgi:hypothetical protein